MLNHSPQRRIFIQKSIALSLALTLPIFGKETKQKACIVYYSRTLNTHILALYLHSLLNVPLYQIHTLQPYPNDYNTMVAQAEQERKKNHKPQLKEDLSFLNSYDTLFIGSPLWGLSLSSPIKTLLSEANLEGKSIAPFITNAGYKFGNTLKEIKSLSKANILSAFEMEFSNLEKHNKYLKQSNESLLKKGIAFDNLPKEKIKRWLSSISLS